MTRSYKSADARTAGKPRAKAAVPSVVKEVVVVAQTAPDRSFQPGDIVSFRFNSRGTVLAVNGNGVQVDFGLGSSWFVKDTLTLVKVARNT